MANPAGMGDPDSMDDPFIMDETVTMDDLATMVDLAILDDTTAMDKPGTMSAPAVMTANPDIITVPATGANDEFEIIRPPKPTVVEGHLKILHKQLEDMEMDLISIKQEFETFWAGHGPEPMRYAVSRAQFALRRAKYECEEMFSLLNRLELDGKNQGPVLNHEPGISLVEADFARRPVARLDGKTDISLPENFPVNKPGKTQVTIGFPGVTTTRDIADPE